MKANRIVIGFLLIALSHRTEIAGSQDLEITKFDSAGNLVWSNKPVDHVSFVQRTTSLTSCGWTSEILRLAEQNAKVDSCASNSVLYRVCANAVTNLVHYPLLNNAADSLSNYGEMVLVNTPFTNGGIYCNGVFSAHPGGAAAGTPMLTDLDFDGVILAVEFMTPTNRIQPILVGGDLWRWGGIYTWHDGTIGMLFNGAVYAGTHPYSTGVWHEAVFVYTATNQTGEVYLDGMLVDRKTGALNHGDDRDIHNTNYGTGQTFLGYLRNLRVWNLK